MRWFAGGPPRPILITLDLEDWFQVENLKSACPMERWGEYDLRVEKATGRLLDLFERYRVPVTFFVLGWIAERCPGLIREIAARGHEIASHGYSHQLLFDLAPELLREEVSRSKAVLEELAGKPVSGFRAPCFSLTEPLVDILGEQGYHYDSSYNSFAMNKRYGKGDGIILRTPEGGWVTMNGLTELPVGNLSVARLTIPWGGGGYFRLFPAPLFEAGVAHILRAEGIYVFYCHPWEFDPGQPRVKAATPLSRFRHYLNIPKAFDRLEHLLARFRRGRFMTCSAYMESIAGDRASLAETASRRT
jgi:polysaccharide deacetylase family protein (PEP-CTERM system associated)